MLRHGNYFAGSTLYHSVKATQLTPQRTPIFQKWVAPLVHYHRHTLATCIEAEAVISCIHSQFLVQTKDRPVSFFFQIDT